jgi:hypothetical protein
MTAIKRSAQASLVFIQSGALPPDSVRSDLQGHVGRLSAEHPIAASIGFKDWNANPLHNFAEHGIDGSAFSALLTWC